MGELLAFSAENVSRLTGLSLRQLSYWDKTGFFSPRYISENRRLPYSRIYSFDDVVGLRTIALLRNTHRVPLQELRLVASWLSEHSADAWSTLTFYVMGRRVYFDDPATGARLAARRRGQTVMPIEMQHVVQEARLDAARLCERTADQVGKVERHRYVVHNAPVIAGTRIPTSAVWNLHAAGFDIDGIVAEYPRLTPEDIQAALDFEMQRRRRKAS